MVELLTEELLRDVRRLPERTQDMTLPEAIEAVLGPGRVSSEARTLGAPSRAVRARLLGRLAGRWRVVARRT